MNRSIDTDMVLKNIDQSINALEYDCLRSAGKTKFNAATLNGLYALRDRQIIKINPKGAKAKASKS